MIATTRTLSAPEGTSLHVRPPALLGVRVDEDEDVEWQWTHFVDGRSVVTGYRVVSRLQLLKEPINRRFHD
jgi:hypothetical protein